MAIPSQSFPFFIMTEYSKSLPFCISLPHPLVKEDAGSQGGAHAIAPRLAEGHAEHARAAEGAAEERPVSCAGADLCGRGGIASRLSSSSLAPMHCPSLFDRLTIRNVAQPSKRGRRGTRAWDSWPRASRACGTRVRTSRPRYSSRQRRCVRLASMLWGPFMRPIWLDDLMMDIWVDFSMGM